MISSLFGGLFDTATTQVLSLPDFLLCVGTALLSGLLLALLYLVTCHSTRGFVATLAVLPAVVCVVIMMVNGNLGMGVAVAGTFNLVRFRSVPGTAREISASSWLAVVDGTFSLTCGGGSANGETHTESSMGMGGPGFQSSNTQDTTTEDTPSCKGLKAGTTLTLEGGTFTIDSADDAIHSNSDVTVQAGTYQLNTGDDGIHADNALTIQNGDISIPQCYEGLEGLTVTVAGGRIALVADDDGLNAAGGQDQSGFGGPGSFGQDQFSTSSSSAITISGGVLYVQAAGDGLDSNGSLTVSGGEVYVCCTSSGADSALDCDGEAVITGGTLVATGPSQMAQNFGSSSTQGSALLTLGNQQANSTVILTDEAGETLLTWEIPASYSSVVVSCPQMTVGSSYTLTAGDSTTTFTLDSVAYSSGGTSGQPGGNMGGQRPGGGMGGGPGGTAPELPSNDSSL